MDLEINKKVYKKKKLSSLYISIWFLIFAVVLSTGLYVYNMTLENNNKDLENDIQTKETSIRELKKDPKIVASSLYNSNLNTIKKIEDYSKITLYIDHMIKLRRIYNIDFKWFKYSGGDLTTQVIARSDSVWINYKKVVKFIREYRLNEDLSALFDLWLIKSVTSKNNRIDNIFTINLSLKNNISEILEISKAKKAELDKVKKEKEIKRQELLRKKREEFIKIQKEKSSSGSVNNTSTWSTSN